jgi:ATP-dependent DNA helicase RecG
MIVVEALIEDTSGALPAVWFNQPWNEKRLRIAREVYLYGPVRLSPSRHLQLVNPEIDEVTPGDTVEGIVPVYPKLGPLVGARLRRLIGEALRTVPRLVEPLPEGLREELDLPSLRQAVTEVHEPKLPEDQGQARQLVILLNQRQTRAHRRLAFDELLAFACGMADYRARRLAQQAPACVVDDPVRELSRKILPFQLTGAQSRVVDEISTDLQASHPMARLVQGDVGSGKTVVAALAMLIALESGHQAALMAPTELLAEQHYQTLQKLFGVTPYQPHLLTSSLPAPVQREIRERLSLGTVGLVVGTHALIQGSVRFSDLGIAVVDEQHRFGVAQRQALLDKGESPHLLVMTATPIPRSLALTLYGDLELSVIDELPPGRQPVRTVMRPVSAKHKLYSFLQEEIAEGGRVYFVYPVIESSEMPARALEDHIHEVRQALPGIEVGVLHGRMSQAERDEVYAGFRRGSVQVLLATTIVEVGVDVPEATLMAIESAERFGLSQLHQLRGRVGRGRRQSWCVLLVDDELSEESLRRLETFCSCHDGFEIAEADLQQRGPGELSGTRQWGPSQLRLADLIRHRSLAEKAREVARRLADSGRLHQIQQRLANYHTIETDIPAG